MVRPEDEGWWDHMQRRGPLPWAQDMFMTATMALAMLDKPLKERLRIAYMQNIYPLFQAREEALEDEERPLRSREPTPCDRGAAASLCDERVVMLHILRSRSSSR